MPEGPDIYFIFVCLLCTLIPATWSFVRKQITLLRRPDNCTNEHCRQKRGKFWRRQFKQPPFFATIFILGLSWCALFHYGYKLHSVETLDIWDPFEGLSVTPLSSDAYIKRQFKRHSLKYHPDKGRNDEEKEVFRKRFIDLTAAYKAYCVQVTACANLLD